jgi:hypothetical protein
MSQRRKPSESRGGEEDAPLRFTPLTGVLGGVGLLVIAAGFHLLNQGSINVAPVLLVVGYGVLIPLALIK